MIFAVGNVEIQYKNVLLYADRVELNTETKDVFAEGEVVIKMPDEVVNVKEIRLNLDSMLGTLQEGYGMVQPSVFWEADSVERKENSVYALRKANLTSCTQRIPRWKFSSYKANFKKNDYIEMWHTVFKIKKIPVFYLPYMRYPLGKEKSLGFLTPQIGFSGRKGFIYGQSFYWPIKRNIDATFTMNYFSAKGLGGGLEYRYLFHEASGQFNFFAFRFKEIQADESSNAYILRLNHTQDFPFEIKLMADVDYQSSFDFLREFDNDFKRAVVSQRRSQVFFRRAWSGYRITLQAARFETYLSQTDTSVIKYKQPEFKFRTPWITIFSPLRFFFDAQFLSWAKGSDTQFQRGSETKSQGIVLKPTFSIPFNRIPWLSVNASFVNNLNLDFFSYEPNTKKIVEESLFRYSYSLRLGSIGPVFNKIFFNKQGKAKAKHIVEPSLVYWYESPLSFIDRVISQQRGISRAHQITYGLTNRVLIKQNNMPREIFTFGLSQSYFLMSDEESPMRFFPIDGEVPKFSNIQSYIRFYPGRKYSLDFQGFFNPYFKAFQGVRLGANLGTIRDPFFLRLNWFKSTNPYVEDYKYARHQINCFTGLKIPKLSLEAMIDLDYNIEEKKMLYSSFSVIYHYQCIDVKVDLKIFYYRDQPETQLRISFGLGNIGKTTDFLGGMGF